MLDIVDTKYLLSSIEKDEWPKTDAKRTLLKANFSTNSGKMTMYKVISVFIAKIFFSRLSDEMRT